MSADPSVAAGSQGPQQACSDGESFTVRIAGVAMRVRPGSRPPDSRVQRLASWLIAEWHRERQENEGTSPTSRPSDANRLDLPDHRALSLWRKGAADEER